jgi:hypothetical protein
VLPGEIGQTSVAQRALLGTFDVIDLGGKIQAHARVHMCTDEAPRLEECPTAMSRAEAAMIWTRNLEQEPKSFIFIAWYRDYFGI